MRIISFRKIREFYEKNPKAETALKIWYKKTQTASWKNFADIRKTFNAVDSVGNQRFVFNIMGNHFRLICKILFSGEIVFIRFVGSHKEYDKISDIRNI